MLAADGTGNGPILVANIKLLCAKLLGKYKTYCMANNRCNCDKSGQAYYSRIDGVIRYYGILWDIKSLRSYA